MDNCPSSLSLSPASCPRSSILTFPAAMLRVAFLGLGAIGRPMAHRIAAAGFPLTVWTRGASGADTFATETGAKAVRFAADAPRSAEVVVTCLSTSADVESVLNDAL